MNRTLNSSYSVCLVPGEWNSDNGLAPILPPWSPYWHLAPLYREVSHQGMQEIANTFGHTGWFIILARHFLKFFHSTSQKALKKYILNDSLLPVWPWIFHAWLWGVSSLYSMRLAWEIVGKVIFFMKAKHIIGDTERFFEGAKTFWSPPPPPPPNCPEFGSRR